MSAKTATPFLVCSCNGSIPAAALDAVETKPARALCRGDVARFRDAARQSGPLLVGCTQEADFFDELAQRLHSPAELRFVNLRELAGWSAEGAQSGPKMAALLAMAAAPAAAAVASVDFVSAGRLLVIGPSAAALDWATRLAATLEVSVLATDGGALPATRELPLRSGREIDVRGHLGAFTVTWRHDSPIDLERCVACGACIAACPTGAMAPGAGRTPRHDAGICAQHKDCVSACGAIGAIDFNRLLPGAESQSEVFDLVLDLSRTPLIRLPHLPDGYLAPGADPLAQSEAGRILSGLVGEFEKPRYLDYRAARCAHSRQGKTGCTQCIDVCSTAAISSRDQKIVVDAHLCAGCGGCATVCPTGAARHAYPAPDDLMAVVRRGLAAFRESADATAAAPVLLVHATARREALFALGARGLPARVIPLDVHDVAAFGLDYALAALCHGAGQVRVMVDDEQPESYRVALQRQFEIGNVILAALGHGASRLGLVDAGALEHALWSLPAETPIAATAPASFVFPADKRAALDFAITHLAVQAKSEVTEIPLPVGAPFGAVEVNAGACTLCMSCVGACPSGALLDTPEEPRLRFVEMNCVQCGLCRQTCPENAIALAPRLALDDDARRPRTLNAAQPFLCVSCGKAFGTRQMIRSMVGRLSGHGMFASEAAQRRLRMCADCRVIDMMSNPDEANVFGGPR